jgi:glycosyltransferase involved in cell wall biosynthesis
VFIQTTEPEEQRFLRSLSANLVPVSVGGNWWVDHRAIRPLPDIGKDVDVAMVAAWSGYKRHAQFFAALSKMHRRGVTLKVLLLGYATPGSDMDLAAINQLATAYGISSMLEIQDSIPPDAVNAQLNRCKVHVLWSRKEGYNRALIEAMLAGVPCILREGHNFGYPYPYINPSTGCFANEHDLPDKLSYMVKHYHQFQPREWVLENMSAQRATAVLSATLKDHALATGEQWTADLVVKTVQLNKMKYWNSADELRFIDDYERILSMRRLARR